MPVMLQPEDVKFEIREGAPLLIVAADLSTDLAAGEWVLMNRLTLVGVDGPGDAGFLRRG
jgi:hypothetical protein